MTAQQDRIDREILRSMAASFSSGVGFSFNVIDMADVLLRAANRADPKPKSIHHPETDRAIAEAVAAERERCAKIADDEFGGRCIADKIREKWVP